MLELYRVHFMHVNHKAMSILTTTSAYRVLITYINKKKSKQL